ncbi:hypothetical protein EON79_09610 [bacterium]|nr:MAG: hypothetical protein EON79_09610 [bacterium]
MTSTGKTIAIVGGILVVLVVARVGIGLANQPDDQTLIRAAIKESIQDSKEGKPGGVLDLLSDNFKVNSDSVNASPGQISQFIRNQKPEITVVNDKALVTGDEARIVSPVDLKLGLLGQSIERQIKEVTLVFRKEDSRGFLFIPQKKWKLTDVRVPETAILDVIAGG